MTWQDVARRRSDPGSQSADRDSAASCEARGGELYRARRIAEAERQFERAVALGGDPERTVEMRWMCAMLRGDFERAWLISDGVLRRGAPADNAHRPLHLRRVWNGTPLARRRVLVRCYHGLGDAIQFIRFVPRLAKVAQSVAVEAPPELISLLRSMPEIAALVALGDEVPPYDVDIEALEIPHAFRITLGTIPTLTPYLAAPPDAVAAARRRIAPLADRLKVGVGWEAGKWRPERSIPLELLAPIAALPGVALVNLQRGPALAALCGRFAETFSAGSTSDDVIEAAALLGELDLVITVDTMMAHLAGALARPVWTLLHFNADWRWMLDRTSSPWYPTMRLFRQEAPGDWGIVSQKVFDELGRLSVLP